jgi:hypothetical protein
MATPTEKGPSMRTPIEELTMSSALSDPLIRTLMAADNVDPVNLESMLRRIAKEATPTLLPTTKVGSATRCA